MANISELIQQQVVAVADGINIPSNIKEKVLGGLSDSILGSLTQTATRKDGISQIKDLLSGKDDVSASPVTALATDLFNENILKNLGADKALGSSLTALVPSVLGGLSSIIKDRDGDGDVDLNDILLSLQGNGGGLLGMAKGILGGFFKK